MNRKQISFFRFASVTAITTAFAWSMGASLGGEIDDLESDFGKTTSKPEKPDITQHETTKSTAPEPKPDLQGMQRQCPQGWTKFSNKLLGMKGWVPPGFFVRLRGGCMLSVEKADGPPEAAFIIPFRPKSRITAGQLAEQFAGFFSKCDPNFHGQLVGKPEPDRSVVAYKTVIAGQPVEGRYCAILGAGGSMAFVIGVVAPQGKLEADLPLLSRIADGFGITRPQAKWQKVRSQANGFTVEMPVGWQLETSEGKIAKNEIDWSAYAPQKPLERAFGLTGKFCAQGMLQGNPTYQMQGYRVAVFQSPQQAIEATLGMWFQGARVIRMKVNPELTKAMQQYKAQMNQFLQSIQAGRSDVAAFEGLAEVNVQGNRVLIAFGAAVDQLTISKGQFGQELDTTIAVRGWFAPEDDFINASPVLDKIQGSFAYTDWYVRAVLKAEGERAKIIRDTWDHMNRIDQQITRNRWDTQDAIAEMYGDYWADREARVNKETGRIEKMDPEHLVRNSSGEVVSREEVQAGVNPDQATVTPEATTEDYMRGVWGRIEFE
jgi:hypothetical protein